MSSAIPPEIITDILVRLPVKSLLRFRSVSKPWCAQIDSPYFIKLHLKQSVVTKSNRSLYIGGEGTLHSLDYNTLRNLIRVEVPFEDLDGDNIVGSCNGLLLLVKEGIDFESNDIVLFNPATRRYRVIPHEYPSGKVWRPFDNFCLVYDSVNDDYKVIRVVEFGKEGRWIGKIYSLKTNSWRNVEKFPYRLPLKKRVHLNGRLHSVINTISAPNSPKIIAAFDLCTEKCVYIPLPNGLDKNYFFVTVEVFEEMLCVQAFCQGQRTDIWVMMVYGVNESWFKLLSISPPFVEPYDTIHLLALSSNGKEVLLYCNGERLIWYNLERKSVKSARFRGSYDPFCVEVCVDSLVLLDDVA